MSPCVSQEPRRLERQKACLIDRHPAIRDDVPVAAEVHERLADATRECPFAHQVEGLFGGPDGAHAVMDASGAEPPWRDLEAAPGARIILVSGTRTFSNAISAWPAVRPGAEDGHHRRIGNARASIGTITIEWRW